MKKCQDPSGGIFFDSHCILSPQTIRITWCAQALQEHVTKSKNITCVASVKKILRTEVFIATQNDEAVGAAVTEVW